MTCREFTEFLDRYLAAELAPEELAQFDRHLGVCRDCVNYLASYRDTQTLAEEALRPDDPLPEGVPEGLLEAVMASVSKRS